jgi:hypothetical protein
MDGTITPFRNVFWAIAALVCGLAASPDARAALGEAAWSLEADRQALKAEPSRELSRASKAAPYDVHELASGSVTVREYLNRDGIVFGVAWRGHAHPDLSSLLGGFNADYQSHKAPDRARPRMRGSRRVVRGSRVVVETFGRMRALGGRAYVPSLLPAGVPPHAIR